MNSRFKLDEDSIIGISTVKPIYCEMSDCDGELKFWGAKLFSFERAKNGDRGHACDVILICSVCGLLHWFGNPISEEHFDKYRAVLPDSTRKDRDNMKVYEIGNSVE